jgi:hypothetical protein
MRRIDGFSNRCFVLTLAVYVVALLPQPVNSQSSGDGQQLAFPSFDFADNGGKLGVHVDSTSYYGGGIPYLRVLDVLPRSSLIGYIEAGDFIYGVNGFNVRSPDDLFNVVGSGSPGTNVTVYYLDHSDGNQPKSVIATLYGAEATSEQDSGSSASPPESIGEFCSQDGLHVLGCGIVALGVIAALTGALQGSGAADSDSSGGSEYGDGSDYQRIIDQNKVQAPDSGYGTSSEGRSYGLYGNCPLPGAGYGC